MIWHTTNECAQFALVTGFLAFVKLGAYKNEVQPVKLCGWSYTYLCCLCYASDKSHFTVAVSHSFSYVMCTNTLWIYMRVRMCDYQRLKVQNIHVCSIFDAHNRCLTKKVLNNQDVINM